MATEWCAQVMDFLPITDVFAAKSVSRSWYVAADMAITMRDQLILMTRENRNFYSYTDVDPGMDWSGNKTQMKDPSGGIVWTGEAKARWWTFRSIIGGPGFACPHEKAIPAAALMKFKCLKKLVIQECSKCSTFLPQAQALITSNAGHLTSLTWMAPSSPTMGQGLDLSACTKLTELRLFDFATMQTLTGVPLDKIRKLTCHFGQIKSGSPDNMRLLVQAIAGMVNLRSLELTHMVSLFRHRSHEMWPLVRIVDKLKFLEHVVLILPYELHLRTGPLFRTLVRRNKQLKSLTFAHGSVTGKGLKSLSRLKMLEVVDIRMQYLDRDDVLRYLLLGESRNRYRKVNVEGFVGNWSDYGEWVRAAFKRFRQETTATNSKAKYAIDWNDAYYGDVPRFVITKIV